jgi:hypothetical protein
MVRASSQASLSVQRLFGPDALSQPVIITVMSLLTVNRMVTVLANRPEDLVQYISIIASMGVVAWAVFSILGFVVNRIAPHISLVRVTLVLVTYIATGFSRELLLTAAPGASVTFISDTAARLATALITSAVMFPLVAGFVGAARRHSASAANVKNVKASLAAAVEWSDRSLAKNRRALIKVVGNQLQKAFAPFIESKRVASGVASDRLSELESITEVVVRPISAKLTQSTPSYTASEYQISPARVTIASTLDISTRTNPFRPGFYIWASVLIDAPVFITVLNWTERFWGIVVLTALGLVHLVARKALVPYLSNLRLRWRVFVVGGVYNLSLLPISVFMFVVLGGTTYALWAAGFSFVLGWVFIGTNAAMNGFKIARQKALSEFDAAAKLLEWKIARINSQAWVEQRNLATFLHGEVQSLILVARLRIQRAIDADDNVESVVEEVQDLLRDIPSRIGTPPHGATLESIRESLDDRWGSFLTLEFECADETQRAIDADSVCLAVTKEVITEFVINAVKHANASRVTIRLAVEGNRVELVLSNSRDDESTEGVASTKTTEGTTNNIQPPVRLGVGSELLESVLMGKQLMVTPDEYRVTGAIPLEDVSLKFATMADSR